MHACWSPLAHSWILYQYASNQILQDPLRRRQCSSKDFSFCFCFVLSFNIRPSHITLTHHQLRKHTLSLKPPPNSASGPARMHGPCRQTRKAWECGACFFCKASTISLYPDICLSLAHPPLPPPTYTPLPPRPIRTRGGGGGGDGAAGGLKTCPHKRQT